MFKLANDILKTMKGVEGAIGAPSFKSSNIVKSTSSGSASGMSNTVAPMTGGMGEYFSRIGKAESANSYAAINPHSGATGKYQFMPSTLSGMKVDYNAFKNDPALQEKVMYDFTMSNINYANKKGFKIDPNNLNSNDYAVMAAMHYGGPGAADKFHNSGYMNATQYSSGAAYPSVSNYSKLISTGKM
jgi:hypothetical protein